MKLHLPLPSLLAILALAALPACQSRPLPTVSRVDVQRYGGKWVEIARLKNRFQGPKEKAVAEYTPLSPTRIGVKNTAIKPNGKTRSISGEAAVVPDSEGARLQVRFKGIAGLIPPPREGNYWIIALRPDYGAALVGTPDRKYLWLLARDPGLDAGTINAFMAKAERLGFRMDRLVWDRDMSSATQ